MDLGFSAKQFRVQGSGFVVRCARMEGRIGDGLSFLIFFNIFLYFFIFFSRVNALVGGVDHCCSYCCLATFHGLMYGVKCGDVIGLKLAFVHVASVNI